MSIFVQFYVVLLGFVNFHMYHSLNLMYPPKLSGYEINKDENEMLDDENFISERVAALSTPITKTGKDIPEENEMDQFPTVRFFFFLQNF